MQTKEQSLVCSNLFKMAAMSGEVKAINFYIARGDDVNATDEKGQTPLFHAASKGHMNACIALLEAGAKADTLDIHAKSAANIAREAKHSELANFLDVVIRHYIQSRDVHATEVGKPKVPAKTSDIPHINNLNYVDDIDINQPNTRTEKPKKIDRFTNKNKNVPISQELQKTNATERQSRINLMISLGKKRGCLTYAEINKYLPDIGSSQRTLDIIVGRLNDRGIQVYEELPETEALLTSEATYFNTDEVTPLSEIDQIAETKKMAVITKKWQEENVAHERGSFLKSMMILGNEHGYLTYAEIINRLPGDIPTEQIIDIISAINDKGIYVYDEAPNSESLNEDFNITSFLHDKGVDLLDDQVNQNLPEEDD